MTSIGVRADMKQRLKSLTVRGMSGYKRSRKNSPNSLILADEFSRSSRGKQSTVPDCMSARRLRNLFASASKDPAQAERFQNHSNARLLLMKPKEETPSSLAANLPAESIHYALGFYRFAR
jgi:hypothetical protein